MDGERGRRLRGLVLLMGTLALSWAVWSLTWSVIGPDDGVPAHGPARAGTSSQSGSRSGVNNNLQYTFTVDDSGSDGGSDCTPPPESVRTGQPYTCAYAGESQGVVRH